MAEAYLREEMDGLATFSLFVRRLPKGRSYLVSAGLDDVLRYLRTFRFTAGDIEYLESTRLFSPALLRRLEGLRFTGSVRAMPEGTPCFADEPFLEVTAPIIEGQLVETAIINEIQLQTMIATKAARCGAVAGGRRLVDFSLRRTQGLETGLKVARASYLAGFHATSNVAAGQRYGIPIAGTMAHSFIQAFESEEEAFRAYVRAYPDNGTLLVDTYDTEEGARRAAVVARELAAAGHHLGAVRLDSGDLGALSVSVRSILDGAGLPNVTIFASGGLDECAVERLVSAGAPIDGFGVGTSLGVSADAPCMDIAYKLVAYAGRPVLKLSTGKGTWPGAKQVWRTDCGSDWLGLADEDVPSPGAEPLLVEVMRGGRRVGKALTLDQLRDQCVARVAALPEPLRALDAEPSYAVRPTAALQTLQEKLSASAG